MVDVMNVWKKPKLMYNYTAFFFLFGLSIPVECWSNSCYQCTVNVFFFLWWLYANNYIRSQGKQLIINMIFFFTQITLIHSTIVVTVDKFFWLIFSSSYNLRWFLWDQLAFLSSMDICLLFSFTSVASLPTLACDSVTQKNIPEYL